MTKIIIVSNRLPVKLSKQDGKYMYQRSEGGLATGLSSIRSKAETVWIGWPGATVEANEQKEVQHDLTGQGLRAVFLTEDEIKNYYEGFSNETLWPVYHYMPSYAKYAQEYYDSYVAVNEKFKEAVAAIYQEGDIVWVHDYQLLLLPSMIRDLYPNATIGFFQHIPYPSFELFRLIPWRKQLLHGMMGADLIGFHTFNDTRHFVSAVTHLLPARSSSNELTYANRTVVADSFPMGIDPYLFEKALSHDATKKNLENLKSTFDGTKLILSIDRLDYSKGILQRLQAFECFLKNSPEYIEKVALYMVIVPSRDTVQKYKELRDEIDLIVGRINAQYRTMSWLPIHYYYRSFPHDMLVALYHSADVCLVTPMRDGMNLVCKEYIACRTQHTGVLILSEMAGASKELTDALIVNPNDTGEIYAAIKEAIEMPITEQETRIRNMRAVVHKFNINQWVKIFMDRLSEVKALQQSLRTKHVSIDTEQMIQEKYRAAKKRVLFLDYDGTLVDFHPNIEKAMPDEELRNIIKALCSDTANRVVVISGRNHHTLHKWFGEFDLDLIAEHGAWRRFHETGWQSISGLNDAWKKDIYPIVELFTERTPGTFIEEKDFSLVWHFRRADSGLGELRAGELMNYLRYLATDRRLQILPGNKVIEIKNIEINKGKAVLDWLHNQTFDFILGMGDDHTDEDIFKALPQASISIKVGGSNSAASYYLNNFKEVRRFLKNLSGSVEDDATSKLPEREQGDR